MFCSRKILPGEVPRRFKTSPLQIPHDATMEEDVASGTRFLTAGLYERIAMKICSKPLLSPRIRLNIEASVICCAEISDQSS